MVSKVDARLRISSCLCVSSLSVCVQEESHLVPVLTQEIEATKADLAALGWRPSDAKPWCMPAEERCPPTAILKIADQNLFGVLARLWIDFVSDY